MTNAEPTIAGERIAVAGGTGFIGRSLISALRSGGASVTLLTRGAAPSIRRQEFPCIPIAGATGTEIRRRIASERFDRIFNLAAYGVDPKSRAIEECVATNVTLACALASAAAEAGVKAFVHVGSNSEYADPAEDRPLSETDRLETRKLYGATKAAGALAVQAISASTGLPLVVARLFNVYGPGEARWRLLPSLYDGLRAGRRAALSPGVQVRDYLHVNDVADGLIALSGCPGSGAGDVVNLCSGIGITVRNFAETLAEVMQADRALLGFGDLPFRADDVAYMVGSTQRLHRLTSWRPRHTLQSGIADCVRVLEAI